MREINIAGYMFTIFIIQLLELLSQLLELQ